MELRFTGLDQRGIGRSGQVADRMAADLVAALYMHGWRDLTVTDADGEIVGRIEPRNTDTGNHRRWWAEGEDHI